MSKLRIIAGPFTFDARFETEAAPPGPRHIEPG